MKAIIVILIFIFINILFFKWINNIKITPDGFDEIGHFIYKDSCVNSHIYEYKRFTGKFWITHSNEICDEYVSIKSYLDSSKVKY